MEIEEKGLQFHK